MKRFFYILAAAFMMMVSCEKKEIVEEPAKQQPAGYLEFLAAYKAGHTYYQCTVVPIELRLTLDDETILNLKISDILFEDCSETAPKVVAFDREDKYLVGGEPIGVKRDISLTDEKAYPF